MTKKIRNKLFARFLPLFIVMGICFAAPAFAGVGDFNSQGDDSNSQGDDSQGPDQGNGGPAVPEPSAWLVMGAGFLLVAPYLRSRTQARR